MEPSSRPIAGRISDPSSSLSDDDTPSSKNSTFRSYRVAPHVPKSGYSNQVLLSDKPMNRGILSRIYSLVPLDIFRRLGATDEDYLLLNARYGYFNVLRDSDRILRVEHPDALFKEILGIACRQGDISVIKFVLEVIETISLLKDKEFEGFMREIGDEQYFDKIAELLMRQDGGLALVNKEITPYLSESMNSKVAAYSVGVSDFESLLEGCIASLSSGGVDQNLRRICSAQLGAICDFCVCSPNELMKQAGNRLHGECLAVALIAKMSGDQSLICELLDKAIESDCLSVACGLLIAMEPEAQKEFLEMAIATGRLSNWLAEFSSMNDVFGEYCGKWLSDSLFYFICALKIIDIPPSFSEKYSSKNKPEESNHRKNINELTEFWIRLNTENRFKIVCWMRERGNLHLVPFIRELSYEKLVVFLTRFPEQEREELLRNLTSCPDYGTKNSKAFLNHRFNL